MAREKMLVFNRRRQTLVLDGKSRNAWKIVKAQMRVSAGEVAIGVCDMWDKHWAEGAAQRVDEMAPRMNKVLKAARAKGVTIIHEPSDTMKFYEGHPARERMKNIPRVKLPEAAEHPDPPQPVDASDDGSDTPSIDGPKKWIWTRQNPAIEIDEEVDGISDDVEEIYSLLMQRGIRHLVVMGVHTNMCILHRKFGIKNMVRRGMDVMLCRDMTDALYNPAKPPYVSHDEGTRLVVEYIEKFWCPTIESKDLTK